MENDSQAKQANRLIFLGLMLFLLGLTVGLFVQNMKNPRVTLSAHLQGVMNGMFLMIPGLIWKRLLILRSAPEYNVLAGGLRHLCESYRSDHRRRHWNREDKANSGPGSLN